MVTTSSVIRFASLAVLSLGLVGCGGGGGGGGESAPKTLNGAGSKGIIIGGVVSAFPIDANDGTVDRTTPLADPTETDEKGEYSLTLNGNYVDGTAVFVEITATDDTVMRCDLPNCGTDADPINFGEDYPLASDFSMAAVLPQAEGGSVSVNVTPLTQMGASLTLKRVKAGAKAADAAAVANAQVGNLLGIQGGLLGRPVVDLTQADAVNGASRDDLNANLIAAALVAATRNDNAGQTVEGALAAFVTQYTDDDGLADKDDDGAGNGTVKVSIQEILGQALVLIKTVKEQEGVKNEDLDQSENDLKTKEAEKANGSTEPKQGEAPPDVGSTGLQATKAFVKQIRDLANTATLTANQQAFADQISLVSNTLEGDTDAVVEGMGLALGVIAQAFEARNEAAEGEEPSEFTNEELGLTVTISESDDGVVTYSIAETTITVDTTDDEIDNGTEVTLSLTAVDGSVISTNESTTEVDEAGTETRTEEFDGTLNLSLVGSVASDGVSLEIADGSAVTGSLNFEETAEEHEDESGFSDHEEGQGSLSLDADLIVVLSQLKSVEDGPLASFEGRMELGIEFTTNFVFSEEVSFRDPETDTGSYSFSDDETLTLKDFSFLLSGSFENNNGESLKASVGITAGNVTHVCDEEGSENNAGEESTSEFSGSCGFEETEESFASASVTIIFELALAGVDDDVSVTANASRSGLKTGVLDIDLSYGGAQLSLDYAGGNDVTISNHNDVVMTLTETEDEAGATLISGNIVVQGEEFADISEEAGMLIVRYVDGTFESAM